MGAYILNFKKLNIVLSSLLEGSIFGIASGICVIGVLKIIQKCRLRRLKAKLKSGIEHKEVTRRLMETEKIKSDNITFKYKSPSFKSNKLLTLDDIYNLNDTYP